jgi:diguanylate cyclase (GGDEF)-like protein
MCKGPPKGRSPSLPIAHVENVNVLMKTVDKTAMSKSDSVESQKSSTEPPKGWTQIQRSLAASTGLSLLLVEGHQPPAVEVSNNNTICNAFQSSDEFSHLCEPYCGSAFDKTWESGETIQYRCHAGLQCVATPVRIEGSKAYSIIGGRAFLRTADYRAVAERMRAGDLQALASNEVFRNVIFASRDEIDDLAERIGKAVRQFSPVAAFPRPLPQNPDAVTKSPLLKNESRPSTSDPGPVPARNISAGRPTLVTRSKGATETEGSGLTESWITAVRDISRRERLNSVALLIEEEGIWSVAFSTGRLSSAELSFDPVAISERLRESFDRKDVEMLLTTESGYLRAGELPGIHSDTKEPDAYCFSIWSGDHLKATLLVADTEVTDARIRRIVQFCRDLSAPLEVLRLRTELDRRAHFVDSLQSFLHRINSLVPEETYRSILQESADVLNSSRCSLLLFDVASSDLLAKAALGPRQDVVRNARIKLGEGIAGKVLKEEKPLLVTDTDSFGRAEPLEDRRYKSKSFISYPIVIGGRKVGVINVTDKIGGAPYDESDLKLLDTISPQIAIAIDRAGWQEKAAQFQLMSITDPLTGLLNRRYLEERLNEELNRSKRGGTPMSFIMLDVDDFKKYNDRNGHLAGDSALELTAQCLKAGLRTEDVASRFGGEEFSILLPQTSIDEAEIIAERLRQKVEDTVYPHGRNQPLAAVTVSIGVSSFTKSLDTVAAIIGAADRALYVAKSLGKNRVHVDEESLAAFLSTNVTQ